MTATALSPAPPLVRPHLPPWLVVALACLASFMVVMDGSIVNLALATLQRDLAIDAHALHWVIDAYLLSFGGCMLLAARAGDVYGRRPVLQAGLALFTAASLAAGLAPNAAWLMAARAVQGIGAAVLATSSMTLVMAVTHADKAARARAMSWWAALNSAGFALGAVAGGLITESLGWRWVMFVNVPVGLLLMAGVAACLLRPPLGARRPPLDLSGAACVTLAGTALVYGITQSSVLGWGAPQVLAALISAAFLAAVFVAIERSSSAPLLRLDLLHLPGLARGNVLMLCVGAALAASVFLLAALLQQVAGYSPRTTGWALLPMGVSLALARLWFAKPLAERRLRALPLLGALAAAAGLGWCAALPMHPHFAAHVLGPMLLVGTGLGVLVLATTQAVTQGVTPADAGMASGLANTARQMGGALGVAGAAALAATPGGLPLAIAATALLAALGGLVSLGLR